jgi:hypothetical protein
LKVDYTLDELNAVIAKAESWLDGVKKNTHNDLISPLHIMCI